MFAGTQSQFPIESASQSVEQLILSIATPLCIIAVALIGYSLLTGRLPIKRGLLTILGCFLLLGSANIARGLMQLAVPTRSDPQPDLIYRTDPPVVEEVGEPPPAPPQRRRFRGVTTPGE